MNLKDCDKITNTGHVRTTKWGFLCHLKTKQKKLSGHPAVVVWHFGFLLGALTIVAVWQVAPDSLFIIAQVTPMQAAMCAVGALAFLAIAKTLFEWFETKNSE